MNMRVVPAGVGKISVADGGITLDLTQLTNQISQLQSDLTTVQSQITAVTSALKNAQASASCDPTTSAITFSINFPGI